MKPSGSGKTHLITSIAELLPPEDVITLTRATDSSFYNYGREDLKNKLIVLEDLDGLKEDALYAFRELQSRGRLNSLTSVRDELGENHSKGAHRRGAGGQPGGHDAGRSLRRQREPLPGDFRLGPLPQPS